MPSTDHGIWVSRSTVENATARFYCNMGYRENSTCRPTTCKDGRWENLRPCTCVIEIPTVPPPSSIHTTITGRTPPPVTPRDDSLLLGSLSDKLQLMWITEISAAFVVVIIALITSLIVCSNFRYNMIICIIFLVKLNVNCLLIRKLRIFHNCFTILLCIRLN